ncbi:response regulator transcription factor [Glaciihabitans sp. dw_435]|uniref:response regulator transcription factor n=1 Tax=Glaciihabitans sp. dw_435 TaxID=2720081 RepID=UPI001BD4F57E|nr:response regulator [Glaciihabitans sp. dw_435]
MSANPTHRVVVADDDSDIRALVAIAVKKAGMEVVAAAEDGDRAWDVVQETRPDLVILDVAMPGMTGIEVCRLIRADASLADVRVLLLSAAVDESSREAGIEAGANDYLGKPFSPRALVSWLATEYQARP